MDLDGCPVVASMVRFDHHSKTLLLSISSLLCSVWYIVGGMPLNGYILCPTHLTVAHQTMAWAMQYTPPTPWATGPSQKGGPGHSPPSAFTCMVLTVNQVSVCPMSRVAHGSGTGWQVQPGPVPTKPVPVTPRVHCKPIQVCQCFFHFGMFCPVFFFLSFVFVCMILYIFYYCTVVYSTIVTLHSNKI